MADFLRITLTLLGFTAGVLLCFVAIGSRPLDQWDLRPYLSNAILRTPWNTTNDIMMNNEQRISGAANDTSQADKLYNEVRVLCWVMTHEKNLDGPATAVKETWGKRCNKVLFASDNYDPSFPTIDIKVPRGRDFLSHKTFTTFQYVYDHYIDDYDWFMKADDDTFVVLENLRYLLLFYSPIEPVYFGYIFDVFVNNGYSSGGSGYVISHEALRRFGQRKRNNSHCIAQEKAAEDLEMGKCMESLQVVITDGRDKLNHTRFHCLPAYSFIKGKFPKWMYSNSKFYPKEGVGNISDYAVTFHYVDTKSMYLMDYVLYHLRPYGIIYGLQDLNKEHSSPG